MEPLGNLLGVPLVVELQEPGEDFTASRFADREPGALLGLVEAVAEVEVGPAVGGSDGVVHLDVEVTELLDVGRGLFGIVEAVVGLGQALLTGEHNLAAVVEIGLAYRIEPVVQVREWEGLEAIRRGVLHIGSQGRTVISCPGFMNVRLHHRERTMNKHNCLFIVNPTSRNPDHRVDVGYSRPHQHPLHSGDGPVKFGTAAPELPPRPRSNIFRFGGSFRLHSLLYDRQAVRIIPRHRPFILDRGCFPVEWPVEEVDDPSAGRLIRPAVQILTI